MKERGRGRGRGRSNLLGFLSADAALRTQESPCNTLTQTQSTNIVLPPSSSYEHLEHPTPVVSARAPTRPKNIFFNHVKKNFLNVLEESEDRKKLDNVKTWLCETTTEQADENRRMVFLLATRIIGN